MLLLRLFEPIVAFATGTDFWFSSISWEPFVITMQTFHLSYDSFHNYDLHVRVYKGFTGNLPTPNAYILIKKIELVWVQGLRIVQVVKKLSQEWISM